MKLITPCLSSCLQDEDNNKAQYSEIESQQLLNVFNFLNIHPNISPANAASELNLSLSTFNFLLGCCKAACLSSGFKPWYVETDKTKIHPLALKLELKQW